VRELAKDLVAGIHIRPLVNWRVIGRRALRYSLVTSYTGNSSPPGVSSRRGIWGFSWSGFMKGGSKGGLYCISGGVGGHGWLLP